MDPLTLLAAHMVGDYILQSDRVAKTKLTDVGIRVWHVSLYTLCFIPSVLLAHFPLMPACLFLLAVWITHFVVDSRRWASGKDWAPKPILVDQALHLVTLAVLLNVFTAVKF